jgi:hypothetical protein
MTVDLLGEKAQLHDRCAAKAQRQCLLTGSAADSLPPGTGLAVTGNGVRHSKWLSIEAVVDISVVERPYE